MIVDKSVDGDTVMVQEYPTKKTSSKKKKGRNKNKNERTETVIR